MKGNPAPDKGSSQHGIDDDVASDRQPRQLKQATRDTNEPEKADEPPCERPGAGLSAADTATGDVTAAGGPRFDHDVSDPPPARRHDALD